MPEPTSPLQVFKSPEANARFQDAYQAVLARWPVPYEEMDVSTSFGTTHVISSGPVDAPALFLIHCYFGTATVWYPNVAGLSQHFHAYAVDVLGEPNKSRPVRPITNREELAQWFADLLDALEVKQAYMVGNSFGGFLTLNQAMRTPERLKGIVVISPAASFAQIWPFYFHMFLPVMLGSEVRVRKALEWASNGVALDDCWTELFQLSLSAGRPVNMVFPAVFKREDLRRIQVPAWLLIGDHEVIYKPEATLRKAVRMMPGLKAEIIPRANHIAAMANPEEINKRIIEAFISS
jgi:pimeloyl-ACP methyl ester carboxylesterase